MAMRIVLISTYELGRQPFGLVSPAAWLRGRGHAATWLACKLIPSLRAQNSGVHICCYGLYAPMNAEYLRSLGVGTILGGEVEGELVRLAERLGVADGPPNVSEPPAGGDALKRTPTTFVASRSELEKPQGSEDSALRYREWDAPASAGRLKHAPTTQLEPMISLERLRFEVPDRAGLAPISKYAHLVLPGGGYRVVGSTEASRGCKHVCRHCPIVPVYNGVFRIVERGVVLADVRQQVAAGAQHISFGDPDFFNGIRHAMELVEAFHSEFPTVTYDVTIKIEHLRKQEQHLARLRDTGCLFVISAVESVDDGILERLDKGHTREDFLYVARKFRELGMTLHPTFVPFTPWTTMEGYLELLRVLAAELIGNVAPIQLGIRLLIPKGSRLLELEEVRRGVGAFDAESLVYPWRNTDARVDALSDTVQSIAAEADRKKESRVAAFARIWG